MSIDFPREEERVLARWKEIDAFLRQVELVSDSTFLAPHLYSALFAHVPAYRRNYVVIV